MSITDQHLSSGVQCDDAAKCIFNLQNVGKRQYKDFVSEALVSKTKPFWDPIQNNNLKLFGFKSTSASSKKSSTITILKKNNKLFYQLLLNANLRGGNTGDFFSCEPFEYPPSLSINGSLRFGNKSDITKIILQHQTSKLSKRVYLLQV